MSLVSVSHFRVLGLPLSFKKKINPRSSFQYNFVAEVDAQFILDMLKDFDVYPDINGFISSEVAEAEKEQSISIDSPSGDNANAKLKQIK